MLSYTQAEDTFLIKYPTDVDEAGLETAILGLEFKVHFYPGFNQPTSL